MKKIHVTVLIVALMMSMVSCESIKNSLPSAPSTEGVSGRQSLPAFDVSKKMKSYSDIEPLVEFARTLSIQGHAWSDDELEAVDGRAAELFTAKLSEPLFPYEGKEEPFRELLGMFGDGALPRTGTVYREYTQMYEKALWDDMRNSEDLTGLSELRERYHFLSDRSFEGVFISLYLSAGTLEDGEKVMLLIDRDWLTVDLEDRVFWLAEDAPGHDEVKALLIDSGYVPGEGKALTTLTEDILDLFR